MDYKEWVHLMVASGYGYVVDESCSQGILTTWYGKRVRMTLFVSIHTGDGDFSCSCIDSQWILDSLVFHWTFGKIWCVKPLWNLCCLGIVGMYSNHKLTLTDINAYSCIDNARGMPNIIVERCCCSVYRVFFFSTACLPTWTGSNEWVQWMSVCPVRYLHCSVCTRRWKLQRMYCIAPGRVQHLHIHGSHPHSSPPDWGADVGLFYGECKLHYSADFFKESFDQEESRKGRGAVLVCRSSDKITGSWWQANSYSQPSSIMGVWAPPEPRYRLQKLCNTVSCDLTAAGIHNEGDTRLEWHLDVYRGVESTLSKKSGYYYISIIHICN